jgi:Spy/CpxP family protein refolding chaperone
MSPSKPIALAAALLLAPLAASAQPSPHPAPHAAAPSVAAVAAETSPPAAMDDAGMAAGEELLAFGLDDAFALDAGDADGPEDGPPPGMHGGPGAYGMHGGPMHGGRKFRARGPMLMRMKLAQLNLTEAQRGKLRDLHEAHARKAVQRRADMQLARMDLAKLMRADKPEAGAVNAQIDKLTRLQSDGLKAAYETRMQARAVLTPEQLKQLRTPMDPMQMRHDMMDAPDGKSNR